ncbi:helix-turn-helix domain-containing protein [Haloferax sp. YSMS24]|uniref:helix-turn-helix domain-containing protein n=1 Tax=Haloferax sp. YSMS24 TaxID=3388425 RepID=UPI00398CDCB5
MIDDALHLYNLSMGLVSLAGLAYLVYAQLPAVGYRRSIQFIVGGFLLFSVGGPLADLFRPDVAHFVHGLAAMLVVFGLYVQVHRDVTERAWAELLFRDPDKLRQPDEWMVPMDDEILEVFRSSDLVLTPSIVAHNIGRSRGEVNRRLTELTDHGLVERVGRGKYQITRFGEEYLQGVSRADESAIDRQQANLTIR